jgi:leader peptidase (prepilin peptidase)/N-methyltransferase
VIVADLPEWVIRAVAFVLGATWGSFFNVAIYRWPREMSVVSPPSHCPSCKAPVPAWRNVPILGYVLLRGRAGCCGAKLSPRYVLVEALSGALALALAERDLLAQPSASLADAALSTALFFAFVGGLVVATFVDLEWMEIPDEVSIGGTALGLATVMFRQPGPEVLDVAIGAGGAFLLVQLLPVWSWERLTGRRGMGEGDSKLLMFVGAFVGWQGALFALVGGAFQGLFIAALLGLLGRGTGRSADAAKDTEPVGAGADAAKADAGESDVAEQAALDATEPRDGTLRLADGTTVEVKDEGHVLEVRDAHDRPLWEHTLDPDELQTMKRAIPFGPFIALGALEFLFFGEALIDAYLGLFE